MKEQEMREIKLQGVTKAGLKNIIEFIYTSRVHLNIANLQDTLEAANFLQVLPVLRFCNQLLSSEVRGFNLSTILHSLPVGSCIIKSVESYIKMVGDLDH